MSLDRGLVKVASVALVFSLSVGLAGCQQTPSEYVNRRLALRPASDPYSVYRPPNQTPSPNDRFLRGYPGYNYGRLGDGTRIIRKPSNPPARVVDPAAPRVEVIEPADSEG